MVISRSGVTTFCAQMAGRAIEGYRTAALPRKVKAAFPTCLNQKGEYFKLGAKMVFARLVLAPLARDIVQGPDAAEKFLSLDEKTQTDIIGFMFEVHGNNAITTLFKQIAEIKKPKNTAGNSVALASGSQRRKDILNAIGVPYNTCKAQTEEFKPTYFTQFSTVTKTIAVMKLLALIEGQEIPGRAVITSDTLICLPDGTTLGKPLDAEAARKTMLDQLLDTEQVLSSSVTVFEVETGTLHIGGEETKIRFKSRTPATTTLVNNYCALRNDFRGPLGKAGGYGLQEPEILQLVAKIQGDPFVVIGLPIRETCLLLSQAHVADIVSIHPSDLYDSVWGSSQWKGKDYYMLEGAEKPANDNFVPLAERVICVS